MSAEGERIGALWRSAQARVYQELGAFPGRAPDVLFMIGIAWTLGTQLRNARVDAKLVADVLNQFLTEGPDGADTGWRLVRTT